MNKDNIFTIASVQDVPVDPATLVDLETAKGVVEVRRLIRALIRECYGWPVEKETSVYGVKHPKSRSRRDLKTAAVKMSKGMSSRD